MAKIAVNGKSQEVTLPKNLTELIRENKVSQPDMVSVQLNEQFVDREVWERTQLKDGDTIDFLYFMGGGSGRF